MIYLFNGYVEKNLYLKFGSSNGDQGKTPKPIITRFTYVYYTNLHK